MDKSLILELITNAVPGYELEMLDNTTDGTDAEFAAAILAILKEKGVANLR